jgi:hypothetical protein
MVDSSVEERLEQHARSGAYIMFRYERPGVKAYPFLGRWERKTERWELVSPSHGALSLTTGQLTIFGFSDYMVVDVGPA